MAKKAKKSEGTYPFTGRWYKWHELKSSRTMLAAIRKLWGFRGQAFLEAGEYKYVELYGYHGWVRRSPALRGNR